MVSAPIVLSTAMFQKSTDALKLRDGWNTTPPLYCFDVSGPRFRLPPVSVSGVIAAQPGVTLTTPPAGQVVGSTRVLPGIGRDGGAVEDLVERRHAEARVVRAAEQQPVDRA